MSKSKSKIVYTVVVNTGIKLAVRAWKTDEQPNQYRIWFLGHKAAA